MTFRRNPLIMSFLDNSLTAWLSVGALLGVVDGLDNGEWLGLLVSLVGSFIGWGVVGAYVHCTFMLKQSNTSVISSNKNIIVTTRGRKQMHLFPPLLD